MDFSELGFKPDFRGGELRDLVKSFLFEEKFSEDIEKFDFPMIFEFAVFLAGFKVGETLFDILILLLKLLYFFVPYPDLIDQPHPLPFLFFLIPPRLRLLIQKHSDMRIEISDHLTNLFIELLFCFLAVQWKIKTQIPHPQLIMMSVINLIGLQRSIRWDLRLDISILIKIQLIHLYLLLSVNNLLTLFKI